MTYRHYTRTCVHTCIHTCIAKRYTQIHALHIYAHASHIYIYIYINCARTTNCLLPHGMVPFQRQWKWALRLGPDRPPPPMEWSLDAQIKSCKRRRRGPERAMGGVRGRANLDARPNLEKAVKGPWKGEGQKRLVGRATHIYIYIYIALHYISPCYITWHETTIHYIRYINKYIHTLHYIAYINACISYITHTYITYMHTYMTYIHTHICTSHTCMKTYIHYVHTYIAHMLTSHTYITLHTLHQIKLYYISSHDITLHYNKHHTQTYNITRIHAKNHTLHTYIT